MDLADPSTSESGTAPLLRVAHVSKTFVSTKVLDDFYMDVRPGEVHGLVGHNGSGKSTFIKCLSGYHTPDPGAQAWLGSQEVPFASLRSLRSWQSADGVASSNQIGFVHQDLALISELSSVDNLALGQRNQVSKWGVVRNAKEKEAVRSLLARFNVDMNLDQPVGRLTPIERTLLSVAAALQEWSPAGGIIIFDEPTAALPPSETGRLLDLILHLKATGAGIVYVSHHLDEIFQIADRVTILRGGKTVATREVADLDHGSLVALILGAQLKTLSRPSAGKSAVGDTAVQISGLNGEILRDFAMHVRAGEIVGLAGLPTSGREELPRLLSDARTMINESCVQIRVSGVFKPLREAGPDALVVLPPDRKKNGVISRMSVRENLTLSVLGKLSRAGRVNRSAEAKLTQRWMAKLGVVAPNSEVDITALSGGNQQKVLLGRALVRDPVVLVLCDPTVGIDIGAKRALHQQIADDATRGLAVIVSSSDTEDFLALCDRVIVLDNGVIKAQLSGEDLTEDRLVLAMEGAL
jgi:ABC-type sugar transport system ATPase subunit